MIKNKEQKKASALFVVAFMIVIAIMLVSVIKTKTYNSKRHYDSYAGTTVFSGEGAMGKMGVSVRAAARTSTWTKLFDFNNEGLTENNYQAYTYDFTVTNDTKDEVLDFVFRLTFNEASYLMSAWNGALEIHQFTPDGELVDTVPDLREFDPGKHTLRVVTVDGESLIAMQAGDYLVYHPSSSQNAMEMPIKPHEATTPGIILYVEIGKSIEGSSLELEYQFHRVLTNEPLFWVSLSALGLWLIAVIISAITSAQIKKYQERHERDNEIINESIETFTGFIDAKDSYTNGHSKRVAIYTRLIAKELGYSGEELDHIYYIALLHDCGKIGVPDNILGKPGRLTNEEFEIIKSHTVRGGDILTHFKSLEDADEGARYHHERYDGKGYPEGRAGEDIPLIARMICVADSYDAMDTDRVYRKRLSKEQIISELEKNRGLQFDPKIADIMLRLIRDNVIGSDTILQ